MKIAVLGAGFTGLTAAYQLAKAGHQVFVFEKEAQAGGLARGFKLPGWTWFLEENYHHFFSSDKEAFRLIKKIGLSDKLFFKKPLTAVYYRSQEQKSKRAKEQKLQTKNVYPLDTPLNFLLFPHLSPIDKFRSGLALFYLKLTPNWRHLEKISAKDFIQKTMGQKPWKVLWQPLFTNKFGPKFALKVPASWFWARIKKRSQKLGYFKGGLQVLVQKLIEEVKKEEGKFFFNTKVVCISLSSSSKFSLKTLKRENGNSSVHDRGVESYHKGGELELRKGFEKVVVTLPTPIFLKITPQLPQNYIKRLKKITYLNALTLILVLKKPFLKKTYWLNICHQHFPFLLLVQHTNFVKPGYYNGNHLLYIGNYLPPDHPYFSKSKEELLKIFLPYLKKINPKLAMRQLESLQLFSSPFAQPVFPLGYSKIKPDLITPLSGLFLANQDQIYPWDRGVNYAIKLGERAAQQVLKTLS